MKRKYKWIARSEELPKPMTFGSREELDAWVARNRHLKSPIWVTYYDKRAKAEITFRY